MGGGGVMGFRCGQEYEVIEPALLIIVGTKYGGRCNLYLCTAPLIQPEIQWSLAFIWGSRGRKRELWTAI